MLISVALTYTMFYHYTDENYKWKDEDSEETCPPSLDTIPDPEFSQTSITDTPEVPKPVAVPVNRFMVSRFSITHVSDSHTDTVTGM